MLCMTEGFQPKLSEKKKRTKKEQCPLHSISWGKEWEWSQNKGKSKYIYVTSTLKVLGKLLFSHW